MASDETLVRLEGRSRPISYLRRGQVLCAGPIAWREPGAANKNWRIDRALYLTVPRRQAAASQYQKNFFPALAGP